MNRMNDVIIIGAGPAGLTAAIYLLRANKKVLVLEAKAYGGAIINTSCIENYPACPNISGYDFATNLYQQVKDLNGEIKFEKVIEINNAKEKEVITSKGKYLAKAVIIATGTTNRTLGIGEDKYIGKGVSYCATCDGNFYKGKTVSVVGGGNTAIEDALYLSDIAKKVYLIHRRDEFRAFSKEIELLKKKDNVCFILNSNITKLNGKDNLESIVVTDNQGKNKNIVTDGLFIAIGQNPENNLFKNIIKLDDNGYVKSNSTLTNIKGIFVAGDIRSKNIRQLVTATSDGAIAAMEAINYLNNQ